ncbi:hypothetical protein BRC91_09325 [Halobacteriales archaeon QS_4_62_28]|nr:MAG: hypothetical protein BRC91_09325 [Halobacteriales archaeon QS_4_62_28]
MQLIGAVGVGATVSGHGAAQSQNCDLQVNPDANSPQQYDTVQGAVDDASAGDTICVTAGTYEGQVVVDTDDLSIRGTGNPKNVVIDGGSGVRDAVFITNAAGVTVERITVRNTGGSGDSQESFGVRVVGESDGFTLENSVVEDVSEEARATGLGVDAAPGPLPTVSPSKATISGTTVRNCRIENIAATSDSPGGDFGSKSKAKGIANHGDVPGTTIVQTTVTNVGSSGSTFGRAVTLTEDDNNVGPTDFEIRQSEFSDMTGTFGNPFEGAALFVGEYPDFGDHVVENNNILSTVENFPDGDPPQSNNDVLDAPSNYWGASDGPNVVNGGGGSGSAVTKNVEFDPIREGEVNNAGANV